MYAFMCAGYINTHSPIQIHISFDVFASKMYHAGILNCVNVIKPIKVIYKGDVSIEPYSQRTASVTSCISACMWVHVCVCV